MHQRFPSVIQSAVDTQLLDTGYFCPIEFLLSSGHLSYIDYERWRSGLVDVLDDLVSGDLNGIADQIQEANSYALRMNSTAMGTWTVAHFQRLC